MFSCRSDTPRGHVGKNQYCFSNLNLAQWCVVNSGLSWGPEQAMVDHHPALQHAIVDMFMMRMPRFSTLEAQCKVFKMMRQGTQLAILMPWPAETDVINVLDFLREAFRQLTDRNFVPISA